MRRITSIFIDQLISLIYSQAQGHGGYSVDIPDVVVKQLDLADLASIKACADSILATETRIDFLVLNAGVMACPQVCPR